MLRVIQERNLYDLAVSERGTSSVCQEADMRVNHVRGRALDVSNQMIKGSAIRCHPTGRRQTELHKSV